MKYRLLAPGPTPVPERVLLAMAQPIYHHRTPAFEQVFARCQAGLQWLFQTQHDVLTLSASGTGAFEAAVQNFFSPGDHVLAIGGGKFAERWSLMGKRYGLKVTDMPVEWGAAAQTNQVERILAEYPDIKGVFCVASETSTGVRHPYEAIARLVKNRESCIFVLDAITAAGVWDICPERDGIDVLITGSQKAFMLPPGLSFIAISPKAWQLQTSSSMPRFYFDLAKEKKAQDTKQTAYTPAVSLMSGLAEALSMMQEEGRDQIFMRHQRMSHATQLAMQALNLKLFAQVPAESVTSVLMPEGLRSNAVYAGLRDRANITIAGGQDQLKGKIFRIAHMGYFDELDIFTVLCALEVTLLQEGYRHFTPGSSVAAAMPVLQEGFVAKQA